VTGSAVRVVLVAVLLLTVEGCGGGDDRSSRGPRTAPPGASAGEAPPPSPSPTPTRPAELPQGGRTIFPGHRIVAFYGTAGNAALGVLGESSPEGILPRLQEAAAPFATPDRKIQIAYELIVTVALRGPGAEGDHSRTIEAEKIQRYVDAGRQHGVLVVLDVQPGRTDFLTEVKKLRPFLEHPHVGLALDPEWRMGPAQVPGKVVGQVSAAEINAVSAYLADIVREKDLPEKLFLLHQFRAAMIPDIAAVEARPGLAMVQHLDGFGTRAAKDATSRALRRPDQFHLGYKLFYDEDINMYAPADVLAFQPAPEYVSYQ
jgi:hypothetical protein